MEEGEYISGIKNANVQVFQEVYRLYAKKLYHFSLRYVRDQQKAEDIVQDVFTKLWQKKAQWDVTKSLSGLLFTLCYNSVMDRFRSDKTTQLESGVEFGYSFPTDSTEDIFQFRQLNSLYHQALSKLPEKRRAIYLLSRHEGLSSKVIAQRLGIAPQTVDNQISAALHSIRDYITEMYK